jgi:hypothetical protein
VLQRQPVSEAFIDTFSVIAIQGLGSDPYWTWIGGKKEHRRNLRARLNPKAEITENDGVMWLRDLLPKKIIDARIASYSYPSDWKDRKIKTYMRDCADQFLSILQQDRIHKNVSETKRVYLCFTGCFS